MLSIEREMSKKMDFPEIIDQFAFRKARRQQFIAKASHHNVKLSTLTLCDWYSLFYGLFTVCFLDNANNFAPTHPFCSIHHWLQLRTTVLVLFTLRKSKRWAASTRHLNENLKLIFF